MSERIITGCDAVHPDRRGGQHVAKPCTGVLIIDDELGLGVFCNMNRSQYGNTEGARALLAKLRAEWGGK
jgi:protein subunit release factor B